MPSDDSFIPLGSQRSDSFTPLQLPQGPAGKQSDLPQGAFNSMIDFIRPFAGNAAGTLTGIAGGAIGGPAGALAGETQGYAGIDSLMQMLKGGSETPSSIGETLGEAEKQALINSVGGRIIGGLFRGANAIRNSTTPEIYKFAPTTSQALEAYGHDWLAKGAGAIEALGFGAREAALDRAGGAGFSQALAFANKLNGRDAYVNADPVKLANSLRGTLNNVFQTTTSQNAYHASDEALSLLSGGSNPFSKVDAVIDDSRKLEKVLTAGTVAGKAGANVRSDLQSYQFMRMVNKATEQDLNGVRKINPDKIAREWNDPEMNDSLETLWGTSGRENVSDFLKNIQATSGGQTGAQKYLGHRAVWYMGGGFGIAGILEGLSGHPGAATGTAGLFLTTGAIGRLLANPKTARIVVAMAGGEPLQMPGRIASRLVTDALQGTNVALLNRDGTKTWGTLEKGSEGTSFIEAK